MSQCLITGGAGFIGSHLAADLLAAGDQVRVLDNVSTGKRENLAAIAGRVELIEGDILDRQLLARAMRGVEFVFHHAAMVSVPQSISEPDKCHAVCATGTLEVLAAARTAGVRRFVYAASSSAYGDSSSGPIAETAPMEALSPYAAGKLAGEHWCSAFARSLGLETVRLRYFNVFGPRQDPSSPYSAVIPIFCSALLAGRQPTVYGDGLQSRDFVHVRDVTRANRLAARASGVSGRVFNVGTGKSYSLLDLLEAINEKLGTAIEPMFAPPRTGDVRDSQADISAIRNGLGFEPSVSLADGLVSVLDHLRALANHRANE